MVQVSIVSIFSLNILFLLIGYVTGKPSNKGPPLSDIEDDQTLAFIIGLQDNDLSSSTEEDYHLEENDDEANELLKLLLAGQNYKREQKSVEIPEIDNTAEMKSLALRSNCYQAAQCQQKCKTKKKKNSCNDRCTQIYDMCTTTTTRDPCAKDDPCGGSKWGKTMPPKWKLLLRAIQQQQ